MTEPSNTLRPEDQASERPLRRVTSAVIVTLTGIVGLALISFFSVVLVTPLPALSVQPVEGYSRSFTVDPGTPPWPSEPAALSVWGSSAVLSNSGSTLIPMASIAKLVCALVSLDVKPFESTEGETYLLGPKDSAYVTQVLEEDGSVAPVVEGLTLTRQQMLELMLLPSANNYALSYVDWMFGSKESYVEAANAYFTKHGLTEIFVVEPTGLSFDNVSSARDLAKIGALALDQPLLSAIMAKPSVTIPGIGEITSSNPLKDDPGVRGMKTGTTSAGRNLLLAQDISIAGRTITAIIVTLAQPTAEQRVSATRALAEYVAESTQPLEIVARGETVARARSWTGEVVDLVADRGETAVLTLGETAERSLSLEPVHAGMVARSNAGSIKVEAPTGSLEIPIVLSASIPAPSAWWRLTHPFEVLGWQT